MSGELGKVTRHQQAASRVVPAHHAIAVAGSTNLTSPSRGLYVGGTGNVPVVMTGGEAVTFVNIQGGSVIPICVDVVASGATATGIIALW